MGKGAHGGGFAGSSHSHSAEAPEDTWNLYQHIESVVGLNATAPGDAAAIFKPHAKRLDAEPTLTSDGDEELMVKVAFSSPVHIRRIMVIGGGEVDEHPSHLKVYVGREEIDFSSAEDVSPTQEFDLEQNLTGEGFLATRQAPFTNVTHVTFFFSANLGGAEETTVQYIGMQGEHTHDRREAVHATYEVMCQHADHAAVPGEAGAAMDP